MVKYQYNYSFLNNWMETNPNILPSDVLQALGTTSRESFRLYVNRKCPMPTTSILRFCNTFDVPLSAFIIGVGMEDNDVAPSVNDQVEPDGGYLPMDEKRPAGGRALRNPTEVEPIPSVVPGLVEKAAKKYISNIEKQTMDEPQDDNNDKGISIATLNKMLDIIAEQQKQIGEQQKQIAELTQRLNAQLHTYGMVADEIHRTDDEQN